MNQLDWLNKLYYGDNLFIMREYIPDECVDLIYLDPPFNSKATYNVLFHEKDGSDSPAQITAFEDTWHWDMAAAATYEDLVTNGPAKLADLIQALRTFLGTNDMMAYLTMMAARLVEMHRVLKPTGSIYLHCDPTASHYIKLIMDAVFGWDNFRNEITWQRTGAHSDAKRWGNVADIIFFYTKSSEWHFQQQYVPYTEEYIKERYKYKDEKTGRLYWRNTMTAAGPGPARSFRGVIMEPPTGTHWRFSQEEINRMENEGRIYYSPSGMPYVKSYLDERKGRPVQSMWTDIVMSKSGKERLGYPTQKPEALLERIIKASSNKGDLVLDPFCGCGTTIAVAERLHRRWIGIDVTHLAITLMERRLKDTFGKELAPYKVIGDPKDLESARALAHSNRHQFEWWALSLVEARPAQDKKKGADTGIDGFINFFDDESGKAKKIVVQVKSGHVGVSQLRDLAHVRKREKAEIAAFVTLEKPTLPMKKEAASEGFYQPEHFPGKKFPRIQILTIEDLLDDAELLYPRLAPQATFKKAAAKKKSKEQKAAHPDAMFEEGLLGETDEEE